MDSKTGRSIPGAFVNVSILSNTTDDEEYTTPILVNKVTDDEGKVDIPMTVNGEYVVYVKKEDYNEAELNSEVHCQIDDCDGCQLDVTAELKKNANTTCEDVNMKVHIRDENDNPVEGAFVNVFIAGQNTPINNETLVTDNQGETVLEIMETGEFKVDVSAAGRFDLTANKNVTCDAAHCELCKPVVKFTIEDEPEVELNETFCNDRESITLEIFAFDFLTLDTISATRALITIVPEHDGHHEEENHRDHVLASNVSLNEMGMMAMEIKENGRYTAQLTVATALQAYNFP